MVKPWQVVLATIGIFVAGLVAGGAITLRYARAQRQELREEMQIARANVNPNRPAMMNPEQLGPALIRRLANSEELNLGPAQKYRLNQISKTTAEKLVRLRRETTLNSLLLIEQMQDEISAILTAPQRVKFESLLREQRQKIQDFRAKQQNELRKATAEPAPPAPIPATAPAN